MRFFEPQTPTDPKPQLLGVQVSGLGDLNRRFGAQQGTELSLQKLMSSTDGRTLCIKDLERHELTVSDFLRVCFVSIENTRKQFICQ